MAEDMGEKSEEPTAGKRSRAKEDGQVAKSQDLSSAIILTGASIAVVVAGLMLAERMAISMRSLLSWTGGEINSLQGGLNAELAQSGQSIAWILVPTMIGMMLAGYIATVIQTGPMTSPKALQPKLERLDPIKGAKKLFSKRIVVKAALDLAKFTLVALVCTIVIWRNHQIVFGLSAMGFGYGVFATGKIIAELVIAVLFVLTVLGVLDFTYQKWQTTQDLKMTKHEVKDERKNMEGDVEMKGRRMRMARDMMVQRLSQDVPKADVVVTNPTHFSVALKYDQGQMDAPKVIAKGADFMALKIRYIATANGIPIVERPPLARALYRDVEVGQSIHAAHYEAVAEVLAYVYRLEGRTAEAV